MKKKITALLAVCAVLSGCGNAPAATTEPEQTTTAAPVSETQTEATTTTSAETTAAETQADKSANGEADPNKTRIPVTSWGMFDTSEMYFYMEDATEIDPFTLSFDYAYVFPACDFYDDSLRSPNNFDFGDYSYTGELGELPQHEFTKAAAGDTFGGAKIASANTCLMKTGTDSDEYCFFNVAAELDGEFEFTGVIRYMYDEQYAMTAGDMYFTPDEGYAGFPLLCGFEMFTSFNAGSGIISDNSTGFSIGNLLNGDNGSITGDAYSQMIGIFGKETSDCSKRVKIKLKNICLEWSDQFGTMRSRAEVVSVEEI